MQLDTGSVLRTDPFSFTAAGEAWRTQSWLAELGYGWLERTTASIAWVPLMKFLAMGMTLVLLGLVINRVGRNRHWVTLGGLFFLLWQGTPFGVARPALLGFLLLAMVVTMVHIPRTPLWSFPLVFWLWASVHGMFAVGLGYLFLDALRKRSRRQVIAVAISGAATLLTAHGLGAWWIVMRFLQNRGALELISEWQPPDFSNPFLLPLLVVILGLIVAGTLGSLTLEDFWIVVPFLAFGVLAERNVWPAVIVLTPIVFKAFSVRAPAAAKPREESAIANWAFAGVLVAVAMFGLLQPAELADDRFPTREAVAALDRAPLFNGSAVGGYLIYADWPEIAVFIDDRAELYGAEGFQLFHDVKSGLAVEDTFGELGIAQVLVANDWPIVGYLELLGWEYRYQDEHFAVMTET